MAKITYSRRKIQAFEEFKELYDLSNARAGYYSDAKGLMAIRKPHKLTIYDMGIGNFALVDNMSNVQEVTSYWFETPSPNSTGYLGAILCFKGKLRLSSNYTVMFVLEDGGLIHDLRERTWNDNGLVDMTDKLEFEFNSVLHPKTISRQKKIIRTITGPDLNEVLFYQATGGRDKLKPMDFVERDPTTVHVENTERADRIQQTLEQFAIASPRPKLTNNIVVPDKRVRVLPTVEEVLPEVEVVKSDSLENLKVLYDALEKEVEVKTRENVALKTEVTRLQNKENEILIMLETISKQLAV